MMPRPAAVEIRVGCYSQEAQLRLSSGKRDAPRGEPVASEAACLQSTPILQSALQRLSEGAFLELVTEIRRGAHVISISGLVSEPARALVLAALQRETRKQFAVVSQSN